MSSTVLRPRKHAGYGWQPDLPDQRDRVWAPARAGLPPRVDLRPLCPPVWHQGRLASCTGHAIAAAIQFERRRQRLLPDFAPSRLFIYFNARAIEGTIRHDGGCRIRDGIKAVAALGVCPEAPHWPYDEAKFARRPRAAAYSTALAHRAIGYRRLSGHVDQLRGCLAAGTPFVFGFTVHEDFESPALAASGVMSMPHPTDRPLGGHAVLAVGYDTARAVFIVRNSWGPAWGDGGYFTMPFAYLTTAGLAKDFWTVQAER